MIRNFFRHLWESIKSLKRNGWMTLASVSAVTVTLILVGIFLAVIMNVTKLAKDIESDVNTSVYIEIGTEQKEIDELEKELKKLDHVDTVRFSSSDEQLEILKKTMGDEWDTIAGDTNPLYDVFIVSATKPEYTKSVQKAAKELDNVERADYGGLSSDKILSISKAVRTWGLGGAVLLLFVAIFLISNTIRITILSRRREIQIMRLVGAKNGFIRGPFFFEGAFIGVIGSIIPMLIVTIGYTKVYNIMNPYLVASNYSLLDSQDLIFQIDGLMLLTGVLIGSIGSIISMRRFLKV